MTRKDRLLALADELETVAAVLREAASELEKAGLGDAIARRNKYSRRPMKTLCQRIVILLRRDGPMRVAVIAQQLKVSRQAAHLAISHNREKFDRDGKNRWSVVESKADR
jgi:hypothetical protein